MRAKYLAEMERVHPSDSQDWRDAFVNNEYKEPEMYKLNDVKSQIHNIEGVTWDCLNDTWIVIHPLHGTIFGTRAQKFTRHEAIEYRWTLEVVNTPRRALCSEAFDYMREADIDFVIDVLAVRRRD